MAKLVINRGLYEKLRTHVETGKVLKLYGYQNHEDFFEKVILFLNKKYNLTIDGYEFLTQSEENEYSMFNGYIKDHNTSYKEITVSFSDFYTKEGNTIISQQVMPMIQKKLEKNINFLNDDSIKKIFLLTSHKSTTFDVTKNKIKDDNKGSTLQMLVKCLVTIGFDVYNFIPVRNLNVDSYKDIYEFIDNINYISEQNPANVQHKQIIIKDNKVIGSFKEKPSGQEEKYFALKFVTAITLNDNYVYDASQPVMVSEGTAQMVTLEKLARFVTKNKVNFKRGILYTDEDLLKIAQEEDEYINRVNKLAREYNVKGTRLVEVEVRLSEIQTALRERLIRDHGCKCLMCDITNKELLIASHIKDSASCDIYGKADVQNAFLLCAIHDKLFDKFLITFNFIDGKIKISHKLTENERKLCHLDPSFCLPNDLLTDKRREYLIWHNEEFEKNEGNN